MQAAELSPEKCIVVDTMIILVVWGKADTLDAVEGSSPGCVNGNFEMIAI